MSGSVVAGQPAQAGGSPPSPATKLQLVLRQGPSSKWKWYAWDGDNLRWTGSAKIPSDQALRLAAQRMNGPVPRNQIDQIRAAVDIVELIGEYTELARTSNGSLRGGVFRGLCPFHAEKAPSFHVYPDFGYYKCFGCGAGGDIFQFVMKMHNLSFLDVLRALSGSGPPETKPAPAIPKECSPATKPASSARTEKITLKPHKRRARKPPTPTPPPAIGRFSRWIGYLRGKTHAGGAA